MNKREKIIIYDFETKNEESKVFNNLPNFQEIINKIIRVIIEIYNLKKGFSLFFVESNTMRSLNFKYRNIDNPTDVLSFNNDIDNDFLGEILICFDKIMQRAKMEEDSIENTLVYLIFHSFLHLLGYNHDSEEEYNIIEEKTEELLGRYINL